MAEWCHDITVTESKYENLQPANSKTELQLPDSYVLAYHECFLLISITSEKKQGWNLTK
jgi:hypothetical protein